MKLDKKIAGWMALGLMVSTAQAHADLKDSMTRLDAASARFRSVQADFHRVIHHGPSLPLPDELQDGKMYSQRVGGKTQIGYILTGPDARTMQYANDIAKVYNPATNCYDVVNGGGKIEMAAGLGFGGSGKDLQASWNVTDLGEETLEGTKVEKLDLVPKDPSAKSIQHITLWMVLDRGYTLKQVLYQPGGDSQTAMYSGIKYNETVDTKPFQFNGAKQCGK